MVRPTSKIDKKPDLSHHYQSKVTAPKASKSTLAPLENVKIISKGMNFGISNSMVSNYMICKEETTGEISCVLPSTHEDISFNIENYSTMPDAFDDYLSKIFQESCIIKYPGGQETNICMSALKQALSEYDWFVFACNFLSDGSDLNFNSKLRIPHKN